MDYQDFVQEVRSRTGASSDSAAAGAAQAVLGTLLTCLPSPLANQVTARLPAAFNFVPSRLEWTPGEHLTVSEFLLCIAQEEEVLELTAQRHAQAVLPLLRGLLGFELMERVRAELPTELITLWEADLAQTHMHQPVA